MQNERLAAEFSIYTLVLSELLMTMNEIMIIKTRKAHTTGTLFVRTELKLLQHQILDMPGNLNAFKQRNYILVTFGNIYKSAHLRHFRGPSLLYCHRNGKKLCICCPDACVSPPPSNFECLNQSS
jgi:hypothetical protein